MWRTVRNEEQILSNVLVALTGADENLEALYPMAGPLSANTFNLDGSFQHCSVIVSQFRIDHVFGIVETSNKQI